MSDVRNPGQIRQQLKQVLFRHLQRLLRNNYRKSPETCRFNRRESLGDTGQKVGVCRWDVHEDKTSSPRGKLCDTRVFGCAGMAGACRWWEPVRQGTEIKTDFKTLITTGDRGQIAAQYPDVAALMWVLDGVDISEEMQAAERELDPGVVE